MKSFRIAVYSGLLVLFLLSAGALHADVLVSLSTTSNSLQPGQSASLTALVTGYTAPGTAAVTWTTSPSPIPAGVTFVAPSGTYPDSSGFSKMTLTLGSAITAAQTLVITATSTADPTKSASVAIKLNPVSITISVTTTCAASITLSGTAQICPFTAVVYGTSNTAITWSFTPATSGSLDSVNCASTPCTVHYTTPPNVTASTKVTVTATLNSDTTGGTTGSASITLAPPAVESITISPTTATVYSLATQTFTATVTNAPNTNPVVWTINPSLGSITTNADGTATYTAPASFSTGQTVKVTATTADGTKSATATVTLTPFPSVTVTVSPATVSLTAGQTQQFAATVANTTNSAVGWAISPAGLGSIDSTGFYSAPTSITTQQTVTVTATSVADGTKSGTATITLRTIVDVGTGASTAALQQAFIQAFYRNGFNTLVATPPQGAVSSLGGGVYGQKFSDAAKDAGITYALVTASATVNPASDGSVLPVAQVYPGIFAYYSTVGAATAGAPLTDTRTCPGIGDTSYACTYQQFDKSYLLVVYANALASGTQNVFVSSTFLTAWTSLGGFGGPGLPTAATATITAGTATTATLQTFTSGEIFSVTSGANKGLIFGVVEPIYDVYVANGNYSGTLGLPTGNAVTLASGLVQQSFEGGTLQYTTSGGGTTLLPVGSVLLTGLSTGGSFTMGVGQTMTLSATVYSTSGVQLTNRYISWISTNSSVIAVTANGASATIAAVGGGTATVYASAGGVSSARVNYVVTAPCCTVGYGATQTVIGQFITALTRNNLTAVVPVSDPAIRSGSGYVQTVQAGVSGGTPVAYLLTAADSASAAYVVTGLLLAAYQGLDGTGGTLGYPTSDATAGGTQLFTHGALGGNPVHVVTGLVLTKWKSLSYDSGAAGAPTGDATVFSTVGANSGTYQTFANGNIYAASSGPRTGQSYFVSGLILTAYSGVGGVSGSLGMPTSDETVNGATHTQSFEVGSISYSTGDTAAKVVAAPKVPGLTVSPNTVSLGGHVVMVITGFPNNSTIRVSQTGQADFLVTTANGAYTWDYYVPLTASTGPVAVQATDTGGSSTASGTLTIQSLTASKAGLTKVQGDSQTGLPGALLPQPLVVSVASSAGTAIVGVPVTFQASSGAQVSTATAVTDSSGKASTYIRLPATTGVTLVTASAPTATSGIVTFGAVSAAASLPGFPAITQTGSATLGHGTATIAQKGALLAATTAILQYHQTKGELASPNGTATLAALNTYLTSYCSTGGATPVCDGFLSTGAGGEQIVNLWRAAQFTGGVTVSVMNPATAASVADLVADGEPVLLSLGLSQGGAPAGGHFVVATGVAADGSLVIQDPSPFFARTSLSDYLNGFTAGGSSWKATLLGAVRFQVAAPSSARFLLGEISQPAALAARIALNITSAAGSCGAAIQMQDTVDGSGNLPANGPLVSMMTVCDGTQSAYQIDVGTSQSFSAFLADLAVGGASFDLSGTAASSYVLTRPQLVAVLSPLTTAIATGGVVNGATFTSGLAPGGIMAIFGAGLSGSSATTSVDVDGATAAILFSSPFQVNAVMPSGVTVGTHTVRVRSAYGTAQQQATVAAVAPAIFLLTAPSAGAVLNQDYSINTATTPLTRGQVLMVYATGLGAVVAQGQYSVAAATVTAVVNGTELATTYAGLAPGFPGLYQVNVPIPATIPPGSGISLALKQGGQTSNTILVALR